jgi:putative Mn2+ efflux pump MntP
VKRGAPLSSLTTFVIRAILGVVFAMLLTRFFYPNASVPGIIGFAIGLVGLAYITEQFRKRKKGP